MQPIYYFMKNALFRKCLHALKFTLAFFTVTQAWSQTLTPQEIKGCYYHRFEVNIDSLINAIELNVCLDDQHQFIIQINADKVSKSYWGTYTIDHDTIHFAVDPYFQEFHIGTRYSKKIKSDYVKVSMHDTPIGSYGIALSTLAKDSTSTPYYIADFESKDSVYSQLIPTLPGDKIQLTDEYGSRKTYSYIVPEKTNEFYVVRNSNNFFTAHLKAWRIDNGIAIAEASNKDKERVDTLKYISFDANMFTARPQHYPLPAGYTYLQAAEITDPPVDNYDYNADDTYYDSTATYASYDDYKHDTVHYVTDYKTALRQAKDSSRYLILYYDAKGCADCGRHAMKEVMQAWNDPYTYYEFPEAFNNQYILYVAPEKDSVRFKTLGAKELPAAIILTSDGKPLYIAHGKTFDLARPGFAGYDALSFYEQLKLHETFTYLPEKIKASGYDSSYINQYLKVLPLSGQYGNEVYYNKSFSDVTAPALLPVDYDSVAYDVAATPYMPDSVVSVAVDSDYGYVYPPAPDDSYYSTFTLRADTTFAQAILDSLVSKYYMHAPADSARAARIVDIVYQFDDYYCPFYSSSFLTTNDTIFNPRISFQYLTKNYNTLSHYSYSSYNYSGYGVSLYELISKRVNRFITYIEASKGEKQKALDFQKELIRHLPPLRSLEMPLYISNLVIWYDTLQHHDLQDKFVTDYLQEIGGNAATAIAKTDAIMQQQRRDNIPEVMDYDYSNNYYYYLGGNYRYNVDDLASTHYGYYKHAETLNSVAWHYYQHVADKDKLQLALTWSQSSLALDPENPYFLDTYAHLLYKTGKTKEAVKYQKKAVSQLSSKKLRFEIDETQAETIRTDYDKMKKKTL